MDVRRFGFLAQIADYGSFSKAASVIGITQPALGRQIRKLEEECKTVLLYRNGRGAALTPEGMQLLARVRPLLAEIDSAVSELQSGQRSARGAVSIGMTPALSRIVGFSLLTEVRRAHPHVALNIVTGYSGYLLEWLTSGRVDVGILDSARRADHLVFDHLADLRLSLVSSAHSAPRAGKTGHSVGFQALEGLPLVLPTRNHGLRRTVDLAAAKAGVALDIAYELDAHELVREMVLAGRAHTIMADGAVRTEIERGQLTARLLNPAMYTRLLCGTSSNRPITAAIRAVLSVLEGILVDISKQKGGESRIALGSKLFP